MAKAKLQALPTMEHRVIKELEDAGAQYADIRDRRIALNAEEADLKKEVKSLMHKHKKTTYESATITIELQQPEGEETVKVKVKKAKDEAVEES